MIKWILCLVLIPVLAACTPTPATSPSRVESAASSGPAGLSKVEVSAGVVLITPGQAAPDGLSVGGNNNVVALVTATPTATVSPASVVMPEGIPLYPGAADIQLPTGEDFTGMGIEYVLFTTTDSNDQVVQFYMEKAADAGWSVLSTETEPDNSGMISQMWGKEESKLLMVQTWQPVDGVMTVQVSWMKM